MAGPSVAVPPAWALVLVIVAVGLGCLRPGVARLVDGRPITDRFVPADAYAAYARGALAEARGDDRQALAAFRAAVAADDQSVELWTRIGAVECRLGRMDAARSSFAQAAELELRYEPLWRARASCAERSGDVRRAIVLARTAAALDPDRLATSLLVARLYERTGEPRRARRWLHAAALRWPRSDEAWEAFEELCRRTDDAIGAALARRQRVGLARARGVRGPGLRRERSEEADRRWLAVDEALRRDDLAEARARLRRGRLDARQLAFRAILVGKPRLALRQATHLLAADPTDTDSRIGGALAADLLGEQGRLLALSAAPDRSRRPSASARLVLAELLGRHVGAEVARAWLEAADVRYGALDEDPSSAPLLDALGARLHRLRSLPAGVTRR